MSNVYPMHAFTTVRALKAVWNKLYICMYANTTLCNFHEKILIKDKTILKNINNQRFYNGLDIIN